MARMEGPLLTPLLAAVVFTAVGALPGCTAAPRPAAVADAGVAHTRTGPVQGPASVPDTEGFTEVAYRALIAELGAATDRLAEQHTELEPGVRADLLLHMAVAYQGLAQYERVLDRQRYDAAMRDCHDRGHADCHDRVIPDFSRSDQLEETARTCVTMLKRLRARARADELRDKLQER